MRGARSTGPRWWHATQLAAEMPQMGTQKQSLPVFFRTGAASLARIYLALRHRALNICPFRFKTVRWHQPYL